MSDSEFSMVKTSQNSCEDLAKLFDTVGENLTGNSGYASDALASIAQHIAGRAHLNAPIKTGLLRSQIKYTQPVYRSGKWQSVVFTDLVRYAKVMHEALRPYGDTEMASPSGGPARFFNLGPRSAIQPSTPEGGVGGKYISRIGFYHSTQYLSKLVAGLDLLFRTGKNPGRLNLQPGYFFSSTGDFKLPSS
jgi:hypothetical protein